MTFAAVALATAVIVCALVGVARFVGVPPPSGRISDRHHRVVLTLTPGWFVRTSSDAGEMSTEGDSGVKVKPYRVSDISADRDGPGDNFTYLWVDILPKQSAVSLATRHQEAIADQCAIYGCQKTGAGSRSVPVQVDGKPAFLTVLRQSGTVDVRAPEIAPGHVVVITTRTGINDVVLAGYTTFGPYAAKDGKLGAVLLSAELN